MKNFVQPGNVIEVPSAAAAVDSGQVVIIGAHIGIANHGAAIGEPYNATLDGVFEVPKATGSAWTLGLPLMWDASVSAFTVVGTPATGDVTAGGATAFVAAGSADATGYVRLAGIPGTVA
ncbi:DUF2190 family protein [Hydrogenophaga aromaticivorans]|uniref:DUF2190 family protein n=1 Tax=Hydrogenophaga aromaticivorans TaxID=2610898 RepID=UPI001B373B1A|nr:DUF2190 family protein [Hydrogenophaga aromaticivorans]MBQ0919067.1 DUF2190 family protein [Hydrogenophaga aromaticivorans]